MEVRKTFFAKSLEINQGKYEHMKTDDSLMILRIAKADMLMILHIAQTHTLMNIMRLLVVTLRSYSFHLVCIAETEIMLNTVRLIGVILSACLFFWMISHVLHFGLRS